MRSNELAPPWAGAAWDGRKIWGDRGATAKAEPAPAEPAPPWAGAAWDGRKIWGDRNANGNRAPCVQWCEIQEAPDCLHRCVFLKGHSDPHTCENCSPWAELDKKRYTSGSKDAFDDPTASGSKEPAALGSKDDWSDLLAEGGRIWADFKAKDKAKAAAEKPVSSFEDPWHDLTAATLKRWGSQQAMNDTAMRA